MAKDTPALSLAVSLLSSLLNIERSILGIVNVLKGRLIDDRRPYTIRVDCTDDLTASESILYSDSRRISAQTIRIFTWMFRISHVSIASSLTHNDLVANLLQHAQKKLPKPLRVVEYVK